MNIGKKTHIKKVQNVSKLRFIYLFILVLIGCKDASTNGDVPQNKESNKNLSSEEFTEEEYLKDVKLIKGNQYYYFSKDELFMWNILMKKVEKDSLIEGDVIALYDLDSNIVNQLLISSISKRGLSVDEGDSILFFVNIDTLQKYLKTKSNTFNFYRKKTGKGAAKTW